MSLAEGTSARVTYKAYASGAISSNTEAVSASDLVATGGQILRRTTCSLSLSKDTYQSAEIRDDRQIADYRHGTRRVQGSINGEISCGTYFDFMEALCRGTKTSAVTKSDADYTSVAADNATSTFIFASGTPASDLKVGMTVRFTNLSAAGNNSVNYLILGFSGTGNRTMTVYPAPTTMGADTTFNMASVGKRVSVPSSSFVSRKFGVEVYHSDLDLYRLFTECRVASANFQLPASGMSTVEWGLMGRNMETDSAGNAPFFTAPTASTTTGILAAVNGLIRVNGIAQGVVTAAQVQINLNASADPVVGQNFVPEIFLGRAVVTGQLTAFLEDLTLVNYFKNETAVDVLLNLLADNTSTSDVLNIFMPKVKFGNAEIGLQNEQGVPVTMPFQALKYGGSTPGVEQTTIAFCDTAA